MAYNIDGFAPVSSTSSPAPVVWRYGAGADARADVETAGYFNDASVWQKANTGDTIIVTASDATVWYKMTVVDGVATGSVTISTGTAIA